MCKPHPTLVSCFCHGSSAVSPEEAVIVCPTPTCPAVYGVHDWTGAFGNVTLAVLLCPKFGS